MSRRTSAQMQSAAAGTGNGTELDVAGLATAVVQLSGTFSATITFEATVNGADWIAVPFTNINSAASATTATAAGLYRASVAGLSRVRARISAYTSGNVTAVGLAIEESI